MSVSDFLSSGANPITTPTSNTTETVLPDWYTNYAMQLLANQGAVASNPFAVYQGPRVADFTQPQQQGFQQATDAAGAYQPDLSAATAATTGALGQSVSGAAQPFLANASKAATDNISGYLNPYMSDVTDEIARLGNQNFSEHIMPGINDQFIGSGNGTTSTRNAQILGQAARDTQSAISGQQAQALEQGYGQALGASQTDLARQGTLAQLSGQLAGTDVSNQYTGASQLAGESGLSQSLGLTGAGALQNVGAQQQTLNQTNLSQAYQDFLDQQANPQKQITNSLATLTGVKPAVPTGTLSQGNNVAGFTPSNLSSALGVLSTLSSPQVTSLLASLGLG